MCGGGEVPHCRQADHGCAKASNENVEATGIGVRHSILHQHEENVVTLSESRCEFSHVTSRLKRKGDTGAASRLKLTGNPAAPRVAVWTGLPNASVLPCVADPSTRIAKDRMPEQALSAVGDQTIN